jgi:hypothetical protein
MPTRPWSRLALALLLLWQLNAAVAGALPRAAAAAHSAGSVAEHCARHVQSGDGGQAAGLPDLPQVPDCCQHASASCHCAQMPALALTTPGVGEALPPDAPTLPGTAPRIEARTSDFFRPPI